MNTLTGILPPVGGIEQTGEEHGEMGGCLGELVNLKSASAAVGALVCRGFFFEGGGSGAGGCFAWRATMGVVGSLSGPGELIASVLPERDRFEAPLARFSVSKP
jgi:hypothetical protein